MANELKECIKDAFDAAMKSYVDADDYQTARWEFNKMFLTLRADLPEEQGKRLNELIIAQDNLTADLASEAYYRGVIHGIELHNDIK